MESRIGRPQVADATVLMDDETQSNVIDIEDECCQSDKTTLLNQNTTYTTEEITITTDEKVKNYIYQFFGILYRLFIFLFKLSIRIVCKSVELIYAVLLACGKDCMNCKKSFDICFMVITFICKVINYPLHQLNNLSQYIYQLAQD